MRKGPSKEKDMAKPERREEMPLKKPTEGLDEVEVKRRAKVSFFIATF
jgi:hypothetical protein